MTLKPTREAATISYPERKASFFVLAGRRVRRVGAVATMVLGTAFWTAGCFGISEGGVAWDTDYWVCTDDENVPTEVDLPGAFRGSICETQTSWGEMNVEEQGSYRFSFDAVSLQSPEAITADLIDPQDQVVGTIAPGEPLEMTLTPGLWTLAVQSSDRDEGDFTVFIDLAQAD